MNVLSNGKVGYKPGTNFAEKFPKLIFRPKGRKYVKIRVPRAFAEDKELNDKSIFDTGANTMMSKCKSDFVEMTDKTLKVHGISGFTTSILGKLKPNKLGLTHGYYDPNLPLKRIIPYNAIRKRFDCYLSDQRSSLVNHQENIIIHLQYMQGIPYVAEHDLFTKGTAYANSAAKRRDIQVSKLKLHRRLGHWHSKNCRVKCPECAQIKGGAISHKSERDVETRVNNALELLTGDYVGPFPDSMQGNKTLFLIKDDVSNWTKSLPLSSKPELSSKLNKLLPSLQSKYSRHHEDKVVRFWRTDNEPVLTDVRIAGTLDANLIEPLPGSPRNPEHQGVIERHVRSMTDTMRATLMGVDHRLWDRCAEFCADTWNELEHNTPRMPGWSSGTPSDILDDRRGYQKPSTPEIDKFRRFGCLTYFKKRTAVGKLEPKFYKGVYLGRAPEKNGHLVGTYTSDKRTKTGYKWTEFVTNDARFQEEILIGRVEDLLPTAETISLRWSKLDTLVSEPATSLGSEGLTSIGGPVRVDQRTVPYPALGENEAQGGLSDQIQVIKDGERLDVLMPPPQKRRKLGHATETFGIKRKPGRPPKRPRVVASTRANPARIAASQEDVSFNNRLTDAITESTSQDEEFVEAHVTITVKQALESSDRKEWDAAITKEKLRLEAFETWRVATPSEIREAKQVLPVAIILTRKRCGTFKARAVILGNIDRETGLDTYAPVVAHSSCRLLCTAAAAAGDFMLPFDLDNAFVQAEITRDVFIRLPEMWDNSRTILKLTKSMYGLKDAPKHWFAHYSKILRSLGWTQDKRQQGLWSKPSAYKDLEGKQGQLKLAVYVDDNLACGPNKDELTKELDAIFAKTPGRFIPTEKWKDPDGKTWDRIDFLGGDLCYIRKERTFKITMRRYLEKFLKKHGFECNKPVYSPVFNESAILEQNKGHAEVPDYPYRSVVGGLNWAATVCRPDILVPVSCLSKYLAQTPTKPMITACKKVAKYLASTLDFGVSYSPQQEYEFRAMFEEHLEPDISWSNSQVFADASFASCVRTLKSTTGAIAYYRGCPIWWRTARQTVRSYSTAESEYIATSDAISIIDNFGPFSIFETDHRTKVLRQKHPDDQAMQECIIWCDNQSAIGAGKAAAADEPRPKSRHFALKWIRVKENTRRILFCPTTKMRADALTKLNASGQQRSLLLGLYPVIPVDGIEDPEEEEIEERKAMYTRFSFELATILP